MDLAERYRLADHSLAQALGHFARLGVGADLVEEDGTLPFNSQPHE